MAYKGGITGNKRRKKAKLLILLAYVGNCCTFEGTDIAFGNPTSKLRSRNAAHTTVHSFFAYVRAMP